MSFMVMDHEVDPKEKLFAEIGDTSNVEIFNNQLLVAVYIRPKKTSRASILPTKRQMKTAFSRKSASSSRKGRPLSSILTENGSTT